VIEVDGLTKRYGSTVAVQDLSFTVSAGRVTGFLGPNGAGKSTTMRVILGLVHPTSGTTSVLGSPYCDLRQPEKRVGALLETFDAHPGRSGRSHLRVLALAGGIPRSRVEEVLALVELTGAGRRRVKGYSLGMRQRLGLAAALLGDPEVLVLDEPANGLDPAGIRWMRDLLRGYADEGGTVLLSSHLLHEIEVVADDLVVIGNGRIVASGTKGELLASAGTYAAAPEPATLAAALTSAGHAAQLSLGGIRTDADTAEVGRIALAAGVPLTELRPADGAGLEEMFLELTADTQREGAAA